CTAGPNSTSSVAASFNPTDPPIAYHASCARTRDIHGGVHVHHHGPGPFGVIPSQLPGDVSAFVNRHNELATLDEALGAERHESHATVVTVITGTAGVGKIHPGTA
ncbi:hypothetical protein ABT297_42860, partial [Dactylosporangium sp. NPDC000555]|uniref:hypothetical protein n=1 Tax=Dactylosporangium sp. NPDC000555 TaxID=3154260 RepID=UPI00332F7E29